MKLRNKGEIWKPIKGFEELYEISSLGRVKSVARPMHLPIKGAYYTSREKIMSPARIGADGYEFVYLRKDGKTHRHYVHRLVADNFLGDMKNGNVVNHINGIKYDNRVENLEWCDQSHNMKHAIRVLGLGKARKIVQYDKCGNYIKTWNNAYEVAEKLGINKGNINSCINKRRKTAGGYRWEALCA